MTKLAFAAALLLTTSPALAGKKKKDSSTEAAAAEQPAAEQPAAEQAPQADVPEAATNAWEYRKAVFSGLGSHMKALSFFVKGKLDPRSDDLVAHATSMYQLSQTLPHLFPQGTGPDVLPDTEALPDIWSDPDGFAARIQALQAETEALIQVAGGDDFDAFKAQFGKVGASCGGCHDGYRLDD